MSGTVSTEVEHCRSAMDGVYTGCSEQVLRQGVGSLRWANGDVFNGAFKDGFRCGIGTLHERDRL